MSYLSVGPHVLIAQLLNEFYLNMILKVHSKMYKET
jgi:hypothetical protein